MTYRRVHSNGLAFGFAGGLVWVAEIMAERIVIQHHTHIHTHSQHTTPRRQSNRQLEYIAVFLRCCRLSKHTHTKAHAAAKRPRRHTIKNQLFRETPSGLLRSARMWSVWNCPCHCVVSLPLPLSLWETRTLLWTRRCVSLAEVDFPSGSFLRWLGCGGFRKEINLFFWKFYKIRNFS